MGNDPVPFLGRERVGLIPPRRRPLHIDKRVLPLQLIDFRSRIPVKRPERGVDDVSTGLYAEPFSQQLNSKLCQVAGPDREQAHVFEFRQNVGIEMLAIVSDLPAAT
jgi:hypothetical protein